jgi:hypothetical protein
VPTTHGGSIRSLYFLFKALGPAAIPHSDQSSRNFLSYMSCSNRVDYLYSLDCLEEVFSETQKLYVSLKDVGSASAKSFDESRRVF